MTTIGEKTVADERPTQIFAAPIASASIEPDLKFLIERGTIPQWLKILTEYKKMLGIPGYLNSELDYFKDGYRNLLLAIYDCDLSKSDISPLFSGDKFGSRAVEFILNLKKTGSVKFELLPDTTEDYAFETFKIIVGYTSTETSKLKEEKKVSRKSTIKTIKGSFQNMQGKTVSFSREREFDRTSRLKTVSYNIEGGE